MDLPRLHNTGWSHPSFSVGGALGGVDEGVIATTEGVLLPLAMTEHAQLNLVRKSPAGWSGHQFSSSGFCNRLTRLGHFWHIFATVWGVFFGDTSSCITVNQGLQQWVDAHHIVLLQQRRRGRMRTEACRERRVGHACGGQILHRREEDVVGVEAAVHKPNGRMKQSRPPKKWEREWNGHTSDGGRWNRAAALL